MKILNGFEVLVAAALKAKATHFASLNRLKVLPG
jgi:hypothetical protein